MYTAVREEARRYAFQLRIPEPVKTTTIAPTGTVSLLAGTTTGIQPILYKYFIRRVEYYKKDFASRERLRQLLDAGYAAEQSLTKEDSVFVRFYNKHPILDELDDESVIEEAADISMEQFMQVQTVLQEIYSDNAISATINFDVDKYGPHELAEALKIYGPRLKGVTVLPSVNNYPQLPYERISKEEYHLEVLKSQGVAEHECVNGVCHLVTKTPEDGE
jgi:ribonucleotide reductase alpha subunit